MYMKPILLKLLYKMMFVISSSYRKNKNLCRPQDSNPRPPNSNSPLAVGGWKKSRLSYISNIFDSVKIFFVSSFFYEGIDHRHRQHMNMSQSQKSSWKKERKTERKRRRHFFIHGRREQRKIFVVSWFHWQNCFLKFI